ncbi:hypothetical protein CFE70_002635 [Pyrenophora teres f. teres 0-1]|uniref:Trichothecene 3-O-acetyltransferase-like N-terminal domain-containing protein n=2 Tax=Pyrenophora teres f. teres TaxID=97479 RepID=E3RJN2_PYRTT|nr:hypothetical protein PTT_08380 [Pyrenophora teres f. teres 0-1]KAE8843189.1 hypothetical protein HRS9139_02486 [Pyrenophora teres f. teres]KAE8849754.1 hypothetical protein PTNB85_00170 [Pyrenophora teres f. teres]KAE8852220.1 hypothetical protein HRS9122_02507 [Pyrenophora teres f. teres]KAE8874604.1 hypothetical protein PTNB73_01236 [Pyrenophora teres f. teres]
MPYPERNPDVLGQFPQLTTYNHGVSLFPMREGLTQEIVVSALKDATSKILAAIPWLTGQVIHVPGEDGSSGILRMAPWPEDVPPHGLLKVKDCSDLLPTYAEMLAAEAPFSMLDGDLICPYPGFPLGYDTAKIGPAPPAMLQVTFVKGGFLLTYSNQHNMVDGTGLFTIITLLSAALRGEPFPEDIIEAANQDPANVIRLLDPFEPMLDHSHLLKPDPAPEPIKPRASAQWTYFRFFKDRLAEVKKLAEDAVGFDPDVPFISPNDALCALFWKSIAAVRISTGLDPTCVSKFSRAIDIRPVVGVSPGYLGQMVYQSATRLTFQELVDLPLATVATRLRKDLDDTNNDFSARSYATFVDSVKDKSRLMYAGGANPVTDIGHSSMMNAKVNGFDFGILGKPDLGRRPKLTPLPGVFYIYPQEANGDLLLLLCLPEMEIKGLCEDPEWSRCTAIIKENPQL